MLAAVLTVLLCGMVLGQRFKMLILAPASLITLLLAVGAGVARAETGWMIAVTAAGLIASLQCGYLLGLAIHQLSVLARARRMQAAPPASSLPVQRSAH
jgi:hypothetical protein